MLSPRFRYATLVLLLTFWAAAVAGAAPRQPKSLHKPKQYKRTHQAALEMITGGKAQEAVAALEKLAKEHAKDAETHYMLAVGYAKLGQTDKAIAATNRAIELGMPVARFVAGTKTGLKDLQKEPAYVKLQEQARGQIAYGPMLGDITGTSVKVWVRTPKAARVTIIFGEDPKLVESRKSIKLQSRLGKTSAKNDFTQVSTISGLKPDTTYYYQVYLDYKPDSIEPKTFRFRTMSPTHKPAKFRIAFGGGAGFVPQNERMWDTIAAQKPNALLLLGDNTYSDMPKSPEMQHFCYYRRQARPEFGRLVASVPVYSIWDDHDFGTNDCWGGPAIDEPAWKRPVWEVFRNNWVNPGYGGGDKQPGCWYDFYLGDVHFIMLDGRYYRTSPKEKDGERSMLGPAQKKWLFDTIAKSKGTFKVLCSPVPWDYRTKGGSPDTWNGYRNERDEIFGVLKKHNVEGVLLMSADRHRSDLWKIDRPGDYALYEFNSSRLTNQHVHGEMKEAEFSYNKKQSFGTVDFDTTSPDPTATYSIHTIDGEKVHSFTVKRSQLKRLGPQPGSDKTSENAKRKKPSTKTSYDPTSAYEPHKIRGWKVLINKRLDKQPDLKKAAIREIESQLYRLERVVSADMIAAMRKSTIWVEESAPLRTCYHPDRKWLVGNGYNPDKEKGVEIASAKAFVNAPGYQPQMTLLHEFMHVYHDQVLGFDHPAIAEAFNRAVKEKKYEEVLRVNGRRERHYALSNNREFFAELSETYLLANDYYPFVRPELKEYDPETYVLLERIWSKKERPQ